MQNFNTVDDVTWREFWWSDLPDPCLRRLKLSSVAFHTGGPWGFDGIQAESGSTFIQYLRSATGTDAGHTQ